MKQNLALKIIEIEKKKKSGRLDLSNLGLKVIPAKVKELHWLNSLDIHSNQITNIENLPPNIVALYASLNKINRIENLVEDIRYLSIHSNNIRKLENLPNNLKHLSIYYNKISKLENLPNSLEYLNISSNRLFKLENLPDKLIQLYASNNQIQKLDNLTSELTHLNISSNNISIIGNLPKGLTFFNFSYNQVTDISVLRNLIINRNLDVNWKNVGSGILLEDNPLLIPPPEIVMKGKDAIENYFIEMEEQGTDTLYEAKLLIVGEGRVGKTTLVKKLQNEEAEMPIEEYDSTHGIDIEVNDTIFKTLDNNRLTIHFWDFGGQAIYHATHQFF